MRWIHLSLWMCLATGVHAAEVMTRFFACPGGQVTIQGGHKPYDWEIYGKVIEGTMDCGPGFPIKSGQKVKAGKMPAWIQGFIPIRSLHSSYGSLMDEFMYSELNETNAPRMLFSFDDFVLKALPDSKQAPYRFDARAEFVLAGITNRISMPLSVTPMPGNKLKVSGSTSIKLADLRLQVARPVSMLIKNGDAIKFNFEWSVGRKTPSLSRKKTSG
jgi:hypothetical protein